MSDLQKNNLMYVLGGTRQQNTLSTMFDAFSEDNGATLKQYLDTAKNSYGTVDEKYGAYENSLQASLAGFKTSLDELANSESFTKVIDMLSNISSAFAKFGAGVPATVAILGLLSAAILKLAITTIMANSASSGAWKGGAIGAGIGVALGAVAVGSMIVAANNASKSSSKDLNVSSNGSNYESIVKSNQMMFDRVKEAKEKYDEFALKPSINLGSAEKTLKDFIQKYTGSEIEIKVSTDFEDKYSESVDKYVASNFYYKTNKDNNDAYSNYLKEMDGWTKVNNTSSSDGLISRPSKVVNGQFEYSGSLDPIIDGNTLGEAIRENQQGEYTFSDYEYGYLTDAWNRYYSSLDEATKKLT